MHLRLLLLLANPPAWNDDSPVPPSYTFRVAQEPHPSSSKPHVQGWRVGTQAPLKLAAR
jgi:hypothetical protein